MGNGKRFSTCLSEYYRNIDLTKCSHMDLEYLVSLFFINALQPSTITVSSARMPRQVEIFLDQCDGSSGCRSEDIHHLSLLECTEDAFCRTSYLSTFQSLRSLHIVQSTSDKSYSSSSYSISDHFRCSIFNSSQTLTELEVTVNDGIILDKQISPNKHIKSLIISLQSINDLYILLDGLVPNLNVLRVTICEPNISKRSSLPQSWPNQCVSHLMELQLIINENVPFTFDQLRGILMPLTHLDRLTLVVCQFISDDQQFLQDHQFLPRLRHFYCWIKTINDINMQAFETLSQRWPIRCRSESNNMYRHFYTVPWLFEQLDISMLAQDDTTSLCPTVRTLIVDANATDISHRFPNLHTLTLLPDYNLSEDDYLGFRRLRHLTMTDIDIVPSSIIRRIHTLTLSKIDQLPNHPTIYSNLKHLAVKGDPIGSLDLITSLVKHFPNLLSLTIPLQSNDNYYDNLDVLLDREHLPHLWLLRTSLTNEQMFCSNINLWVTANTRLRWRSTRFYAYVNGKDLIICL